MKNTRLTNEMDILKTIIKGHDINISKLARRMGLKTSNLWQRINKTSTLGGTIRNYVELLDALGFSLVVVPSYRKHDLGKEEEVYFIEQLDELAPTKNANSTANFYAKADLQPTTPTYTHEPLDEEDLEEELKNL